MFSCGSGNKKNTSQNDSIKKADSIMISKINGFATVKLTTDLSKLSEKEKQMLPILIDIAQIMDELFWMQTYGDKKALIDEIKNENEKKFALINYGPWEHLNGNKSFIASFGEKPLGANYYPVDMTKEEFEKLDKKDKKSLYTVIRRNEDKSLKVVWYSQEYKEQLTKASELLKKAATLAEDAGLKKYLTLRAEALLSNNYQPSDFAWMEMKNNHIDFVVGPIENYDDALFEYKAAFEAFVLIKDKEWSKKLEKYTAMLPALQKQLPVDQKYKNEKPGTSSDLGVYDVIYYAGDCNAGSKTIAINLPNDEQVQLKKGSRRLQLKNAMKAKFDNILMPIAAKLIDPSQLKNVKFDAFFNNVMFHEVAHGLGIKNTINGKGTTKDGLKEIYSAFEEAKADILGLFMATKLIGKGEIKDLTVDDCYITFMAGIFRSVRFGAASSHGKANMMCFNFFESMGAFTRSNEETYKVDLEKIKTAVDAWGAKILVFQGNADYEGAKKFLVDNAIIKEQLQKDLDALKTANIPVDIIFDQGKETLGLK
ncbi:MAG: Zn-dependent hydrolase [Bacteroidetes bacterium CG2_30_32_10]|nr:MAG: Zn-dependent hydrolase [Bacteroidetes bacterium CG2_30_32_10]